MTMVAMTALTVFANAQIVNKRANAARRDTVGNGDPFEAPWHVAQDLARGGLARPVEVTDLDREPTEDVEPHPSISAPDLHRINAARRQRRDGAPRAEAQTPSPSPPTAITGASFVPSLETAQPASVAAMPAAVTSGVKSNAPAVPPAPGAAAPAATGA